ncbi:ATP-binding protein [Kribbella qitaiheensis]|uniref:ATP-binding protein n=1 Tax=Kribbella qitaiheensis TaxID=1544730 RepID=A0A7G6WVY2_9ACTN|nr:ATP-binding protein [Kribbella qitaiheensis]QNE18147.1 ATP-binding protein [Kribbella qitaiheensis]
MTVQPLIPQWRITEVPLVGGPDTNGGQRLTALRRGLLPALMLQASAGRPFSFCWTRASAGGPIEVRAGIEPSHGAVSYPAGARAVAADPIEFPYWVSVDGLHDVLTALPEAEVEPAGTLEDFAEVLPAFAWQIQAVPISEQERRELLDDLHLQITVGLDREKISGRDALELERNRARYRDFSAAQGGLWSAQIFAGGADEDSAKLAAQTLAGVADLHTTPYTLTTQPSTRDETTGFKATGELLAAIARPPVREIAGVRVVEQVRFDLTPETPPDGIPLGDVIDASGRAVGTMTVSQSTLNRHAFVAGATGSGKSQTIRHLLEGLTDASVPWLVIEPAKAEYAAMAGRLGSDSSVAVIRLGDPDAVPLSLNPLEPEAGFPLQTHLDLVRALFLAAFEANEPFPQVLSQALTRCYTSYGWDLALSRGGTEYPSLADLQTTARTVVDDIGYGAELAADVRGFVDVRLTSLLLGTPGRFLGGGYPLDVADLLSRNVVLELEDVGDDQDKAFCMGVVLIRLIEHLRVRRGPSSNLRHVTVVEEAHRLLKASADGTTSHAVEMFAGLLAEIRAYGEGIVVAEQIPSKVIPDVVKNSALKILHRLPAADDRETVGATMNLDEPQSRAVVSLPSGQAAVFTDGMDRPVRVRIPHGEPREQRAATPPTVKAAGRRNFLRGGGSADRLSTVREIADVAQLLEHNPRFVLWVELLTVAHLVAAPRPVPGSPWVFNDVSSGVVECAIEESVSSAVFGRLQAIEGQVVPARLAAHLTEVVRGVVREQEFSCAATEIEWQAGAFRFADVADALRTHTGPLNAPHPLTNEWGVRGLKLWGSTIEEQIWSFLKVGSASVPPALLLGDGSLLRAAASLSIATDPYSQLLEATHGLIVPGHWHRYVFRTLESAGE